MGNITKETSAEEDSLQKQSEYLKEFAALCARQVASVYAVLAECEDISLEDGLETALRRLVQSREIAMKTLADYEKRYDQLYFEMKQLKKAA